MVFLRLRQLKQAIAFYALLPLIYGIACLPYRLIYIISDMLYCGVSRFYRRDLVRKNLHAAFPHKSRQELVAIESAFYVHFCDLLVEYIKSLTISKQQTLERCVIQNVALLENFYKEGRDILLVTGHYGNWEWAANAIALQTNYKVSVVYKSLSNPYFNQLVNTLRKRFNKSLIHDKSIFRTLLTCHKEPQATAFLADQAPPLTHALPIEFLNIRTYVTIGLEKIAQKCNPVVIYVRIEKLRRGYYTITLEVIEKQPRSLEPSILTRRYIQCLEKDIYHNPGLWLWSHNRWAIARS